MKRLNLGSVSRPVWLGILAAGLSAPFVVFSVVNVDTDNIFELDGNAVTTGTGDDWDEVASGNNLDAEPASFITDIYPPSLGDNVFAGGGSKDGRNISGPGQTWANSTALNDKPPDKNNLEHAFAAAYRNAATDFDLHIYFGADRYDNSGDSAVGFWFFQDRVAANGDGTFSGVHMEGDILVTSDFRNGGGVSVINVYKWVGGNNPLLLLVSGAPQVPGVGTTPFCLTQDGFKVACGIANRSDAAVPSPWPGGYGFKGVGSSNLFRVSTLYEGGINITRLLGTSNTCFSSFMAMTRTSASTTAILKDFVLGEFPLCGISVAKSCNGPTTISADGEHFNNKYTVTVSNTGAGPVQNAAFIETANIDNADYKCKLTHIGATDVDDVPLVKDAENVIAPTLVSGASVTATVECDTLDNPFNNTVSAVADADLSANVFEVSADSVETDPGCSSFQFLGALLITKECANRFEGGNLVTPATTIDASLGLQVCVDISVTNDSTETVEDILISDDKLPADQIPDAFTLAPGASEEFTNLCYDPTEGDDTTETNPGAVLFTDEASASGTGRLSDSTVASSIVTATCSLCPCEDCGTP
jgi:hypothetical protein